MNTLNNLLDSARKMCLSDSDNALSKKMGLSRSAVSVWRKGGKITDEHLFELIHIAKADLAIFAQIRVEEAAANGQARKAWTVLRDRLSAAAAVVALVVLAPAGLNGKSVDIQRVTHAEFSTLHIMSKLRRVFARFWPDWFADSWRPA